MKYALFLMCFCFVAGCGDYDDDKSDPPPPPPQLDQKWLGIKPVLFESCGGANCHSGGRERDKIIQSKAGFFGSIACARVENGSMPPNGSLDAAMKDAILAYCESQE